MSPGLWIALIAIIFSVYLLVVFFDHWRAKKFLKKHSFGQVITRTAYINPEIKTAYYHYTGEKYPNYFCITDSKGQKTEEYVHADGIKLDALKPGQKPYIIFHRAIFKRYRSGVLSVLPFRKVYNTTTAYI